MCAKLKTVLFSLFLFSGLTLPASDMPYEDNQFACAPQDVATRYTQDFKINVAGFGGNELCNSNVDFKKLLNDLFLIEKGSFSTGQNLFIRGFVKANEYYSWMKSQTRGIDRGQDIPTATAYNSGGYFTMQDGWAKLSTLGRVGTVIHEARHTAGYRHTPCFQGPYKDVRMDACDKNYEYGGSHAVEMEYYARVSVLGTNFHPVYKKMARHMAIARSNIFFNKLVLQQREALLALTASKDKALLLDEHSHGTEWLNKETPSASGVLKRTSFGAVVFDGKKAFTIDPYQNSGFPDLVPDTYSYFKLLNEKISAPVQDLEEFDLGNKRYLVKLENNALTPFNFSTGAWGKSVPLNFTVIKTSTAASTPLASGYYLVDNNNLVYSYDPVKNSVSPVNIKGWNPDYLKVVNYKSETLVLKTSGSLVSLDPVTAQEKPWSLAPATPISDFVAIPVYDGFDVAKE